VHCFPSEVKRLLPPAFAANAVELPVRVTLSDKVSPRERELHLREIRYAYGSQEMCASYRTFVSWTRISPRRNGRSAELAGSVTKRTPSSAISLVLPVDSAMPPVENIPAMMSRCWRSPSDRQREDTGDYIRSRKVHLTECNAWLPKNGQLPRQLSENPLALRPGRSDKLLDFREASLGKMKFYDGDTRLGRQRCIVVR